jgi:hypothetical protein
LNTCEANIDESKRTCKEIKEAFEEYFHSLNKESLGLGKYYHFEILGQVDIAKHQLGIKTSLEEAHAEISQLELVDITQIDRWMAKPKLQLHPMTSDDKRLEDKLPQLEKILYVFEVNDVTEPSRLITQFVSRCVECIERGKGSTSKKQ